MTDSPTLDQSSRQELYDAEYAATYAAAGRMLAQALSESRVDRYAKVAWQSDDGSSGVIDLDVIQSNDLATIRRIGALPA